MIDYEYENELKKEISKHKDPDIIKKLIEPASNTKSDGTSFS